MIIEFNSIKLDIKSGKMNSIVGPNNSNKSSIINKLKKELNPSEVIYFSNSHIDLNSINGNIKYILIDDFCLDNTKKETKDIVNLLKKISNNNITIVCATINLEAVCDFDYLYIIDGDKIVLEGIPNDVLVHDNILNKLGLPIPFMYDLPTKLSDYGIIDHLELDMDRMVDTIWK